MHRRASTRSTTFIAIRPRSARHWSAGPIGFATSSRLRRQTSVVSGWPVLAEAGMRDPTTDLVVKELTELAIQYLCERELRELNEAINASFAITASFLKRPKPSACRPPAPRNPAPPPHPRNPPLP